MALRDFHGLIQLAFAKAHEQYSTLRIDSSGTIWRLSPIGWTVAGKISDPQAREDFLLSQLPPPLDDCEPISR